MDCRGLPDSSHAAGMPRLKLARENGHLVKVGRTPQDRVDAARAGHGATAAATQRRDPSLQSEECQKDAPGSVI